ncbi:MAG: hypothetical protein QOE24_281, partial [Frankiales bacterium]|nr:hypothetical protein [Frankiales bacterium]
RYGWSRSGASCRFTAGMSASQASPSRSAIIGRGLVLGIVGGAVMGQLAMVLIVLVLLAARL